MEASQFLRDEHKRIVGLLRQASATIERTPEMFLRVSRQMKMELETYLQIKRELVYPSILATSLSTTLQSDHETEDVLKRITTLAQTQSGAGSVMQELTFQVEECFKNEEQEVFPYIKGVSGDLLQERQMMLQRSPEYEDARPEIVQNPQGGEQMRKSACS